MRFASRSDAGARLGHELEHLRGEDVVVLGVPRGGVPVAAEIAEALSAPLDVVLVRKLGVPFQPELAMGAIGEAGIEVLNDEILSRADVTESEVAAVVARERDELERRVRRYRGGRTAAPISGRTAIVVDDGIATGASIRAALDVVRAHHPRKVVLVVPVAAAATVERLVGLVDELVVLSSPEPFVAVGAWYDDFSPTTDEEVVRLLTRARPTPTVTRPRRADVAIPAGSAVELHGHLDVPERAIGLVIFAHGSGSSRHSPRNRHVARMLRTHGIGTLLLDLLTPAEEHDRRLVFDIELLGERLGRTARWVRDDPVVGALPIGYFGASTGAGAALWAAAEPGSEIAAVVSRGGRPDLATTRLPLVTAPTLLIVGARDEVVVELNREAARRLGCEHRLEVVPRATHLFEEPGALDDVARLAAEWFTRHF